MIGDSLSNRYILFGSPKCLDTAKCLHLAAEKGIDVDARVVNSGGEDAQFCQISPLGEVPALLAGQFSVYGALGILSYLDDKGFGPSLIPRNGVVRAAVYQWIHVAVNLLQPKISAGKKDEIVPPISCLDEHLANSGLRGGFICGAFSMADIHWTACCHAIQMSGSWEAMGEFHRVSAWFDAVKQHPSSSKEDIIPFTALPDHEDVKTNTLRDVLINT